MSYGRIILFFIVAFLVFASGCIGKKDVIELDGVEVREYKGEKLSSIDDFRENSIKGPQYIDNDSYLLDVGGLADAPKQYS